MIHTIIFVKLLLRSIQPLILDTQRLFFGHELFFVGFKIRLYNEKNGNGDFHGCYIFLLTLSLDPQYLLEYAGNFYLSQNSVSFSVSKDTQNNIRKPSEVLTKGDKLLRVMTGTATQAMSLQQVEKKTNNELEVTLNMTMHVFQPNIKIETNDGKNPLSFDLPISLTYLYDVKEQRGKIFYMLKSLKISKIEKFPYTGINLHTFCFPFKGETDLFHSFQGTKTPKNPRHQLYESINDDDCSKDQLYEPINDDTCSKDQLYEPLNDDACSKDQLYEPINDYNYPDEPQSPCSEPQRSQNLKTVASVSHEVQGIVSKPNKPNAPKGTGVRLGVASLGQTTQARPISLNLDLFGQPPQNFQGNRDFSKTNSQHLDKNLKPRSGPRDIKLQTEDAIVRQKKVRFSTPKDFEISSLNQPANFDKGDKICLDSIYIDRVKMPGKQDKIDVCLVLDLRDGSVESHSNPTKIQLTIFLILFLILIGVLASCVIIYFTSK